MDANSKHNADAEFREFIIDMFVEHNNTLKELLMDTNKLIKENTSVLREINERLRKISINTS